MLVFFYFIADGSNRLVVRSGSGSSGTENRVNNDNEQNTLGSRSQNRLLRRPSYREMHFLNYSFNSLFLIFFSVGLRALERQSKFEKLQKELEKEKINSELAFLKNQISPHFFFNTLNNIYSLISINTDDSQKAILKLSKLMRYLLYESETGNTHLSNEIEFMNNYIDLMKLRISDKINVTINFPEEYDDFALPPLLFISYIENAFKHGISYREKSFIDIKMQAENKIISFRCTNSLVKSREELNNEYSGIGMENVRKRLCLLYPDKHDLKINKSESEFEVLLNINFS